MLNKVSIMLLLVLLVVILSHTTIAQPPLEPIARTEAVIRDQHEQTREWCQAQWNEKSLYLEERILEQADNLEKQARQMFWLDRFLTFGLVFLAVFLALTLRTLLDHRKDKRYMDLKDKEEQALPELSEPPEPDKTKVID